MQPGARICPGCGADLAGSSPDAGAAPARPWWILPVAITAVTVVGLLILLYMPFGDREESETRPRTAGTIDEGSPVPSRPAETGTIVDLDRPPETTTTAMAAPGPPVVAVPPPPVPAAPPPPDPEISEAEAINTLRGYVTSRRYYDTGPECIGITSAGYANAGYTLEVHDTCASRRLGRWRVDSKTREVFVQREDGRFLEP